ncbi:MAG: hypothetical protein JO154_13015 [Chitinophaga sp.]|uniref:glycosyl hydrolase family 95 catalytic domain-containing protein n=1 Tax=Chitinophaga sp. TaxID=1869181 RepID=UPI0025C43C3A|nr:hypothetical protein [Chitinophaga sp.]MBV8253520.1 hypothetical protein [Chitinophaga sp.]
MKLKRPALLALLYTLPIGAMAQQSSHHNLHFNQLATNWYDAMPLGNGMLGALVWQNNQYLRLSLDRADLWDDRPMPGMDKLTFSWVTKQVQLHQYDAVQALGDAPYEANPAPTKIPGAAIEFNIADLGNVVSNELDITTATNIIRFSNGAIFKTYVDASESYGVFTGDNIPSTFIPAIRTPQYTSPDHGGPVNSVEGQSLQRLGYAKGVLKTTGHQVIYHQPTNGGKYYEVLVSWKRLPGNKLAGIWMITNTKRAAAPTLTDNFLRKSWLEHTNWWKNYWNRSSIQIPDTLLEKQYYLDMYKFGCVARNNTPPISLQAVWTADNGKLPPWKGDFHHDLNTELSYWPGYTANHTDLTAGFTNWLWNTQSESKRWTKQYFGIDGLNVPGVNTISGKPMGGWIQYSMSPTTAAWLSQHFYWQWRYTNDKQFLLTRCKPWFDAVAAYFRGIRIVDPVSGKFKHPLSSAPEFNDNSISAWFHDFTNYDLSLVRFFFEKYAVVTAACGQSNAAILAELQKYPAFNTDSTGLTIAPGQELNQSHRHHSHLMAIYPLKVLSYSSAADKSIMDRSLAWLEKKGTRAWCGYSFSWAANLYAQTGNGDSAAVMLSRFASNFTGKNSFHLNGDQKKGQYSGFTYNPFTLEGNFASAQGIHEMLLQSNDSLITLFPAVPASWKNVSFEHLRTASGCLVSAERKNGQLAVVKISGGQPGKIYIQWPFSGVQFNGGSPKYELKNGVLSFEPGKGEITIYPR